MFHVSTLAGFTLVIGLILNASAVAQEAFLKKGTVALNPNDERTLFLYIPGYTLLYDLGKRRTIRSRTRGDQEKYRFATTQDGIRVLVREADIRTNVEVLENYHFLVNRRMPLCDTMDDCNDIWNHFSNVGDDGENWSAMWARVAGKFMAFSESENSELCAVPDGGPLEVFVSIGGSEDKGFIPRTRNRLKLEEAGFITLLNCQYPTYFFEESRIKELDSPCTQEHSQKKIASLWRGIQNSKRGSLFTEFGAYLSFLGLGARVEAFRELSRGQNDETIEESSIVYGKLNEEWQVKFVEIFRRLDDNTGEYSSIGKTVVRKVFQCEAGRPTEMKFASFFVDIFPKNEERYLEINLNESVIAGLKLKNNKLDGGLVSINRQDHHYKLLDYFLKKGVPKSIANLFIKEINVAEPRQ